MSNDCQFLAQPKTTILWIKVIGVTPPNQDHFEAACRPCESCDFCAAFIYRSISCPIRDLAAPDRKLLSYKSVQNQRSSILGLDRISNKRLSLMRKYKVNVGLRHRGVNFLQFIKNIYMRVKTKNNVPLVFPLSSSKCTAEEARFTSFAMAGKRKLHISERRSLRLYDGAAQISHRHSHSLHL